MGHDLFFWNKYWFANRSQIDPHTDKGFHHPAVTGEFIVYPPKTFFDGETFLFFWKKLFI